MARQSAAALAAQESAEKTHELLGKLISMQIESKNAAEAKEKEMEMAMNPLRDAETVDKKKLVIDARMIYMVVAAVAIAAYTVTSTYNNMQNDINELKKGNNTISKIEQVQVTQDKTISLLTAKQDEMLSKISDISDDTKRLNSQVSTALNKISNK